jgi:hypothetical protein
MAEITLGDYTGYIFLEIIKARGLADQYSRDVASMYAQDELLKYFSAPRFKIPKMELTIPVLISGARFRQAIAFRMELEAFATLVRGRLESARRTLQIRQVDWFRRIEPRIIPVEPRPFPRPGPVGAGSAEVDSLIREFFDALTKNTDPLQQSTTVSFHWARILKQDLVEAKLMEVYTAQNPNNELLLRTTAEMQGTITANTVIDRTTIESLLINPETQVVRDGSSDATVFTIKAEMMEESFFIRSVKDDVSGNVTRVVEFE